MNYEGMMSAAYTLFILFGIFIAGGFMYLLGVIVYSIIKVLTFTYFGGKK